jgi:THO complex subunit 1 transcription elongation factor
MVSIYSCVTPKIPIIWRFSLLFLLRDFTRNDTDFFFVHQKEEIKSCEERVKRLLEIIPPKGKEFLQSVEHILEREKNWVNIFFNISFHSFLEV